MAMTYNPRRLAAGAAGGKGGEFTSGDAQRDEAEVSLNVGSELDQYREFSTPEQRKSVVEKAMLEPQFHVTGVPRPASDESWSDYKDRCLEAIDSDPEKREVFRKECQYRIREATDRDAYARAYEDRVSTDFDDAFDANWAESGLAEQVSENLVLAREEQYNTPDDQPVKRYLAEVKAERLAREFRTKGRTRPDVLRKVTGRSSLEQRKARIDGDSATIYTWKPDSDYQEFVDTLVPGTKVTVTQPGLMGKERRFSGRVSLNPNGPEKVVLADATGMSIGLDKFGVPSRSYTSISTSVQDR